MSHGTNTMAIMALATIVIAGARVGAPRNVIVDAPPAIAGGRAAPLAARDTARFSITIDPWRAGVYALGAGNTLRFPAGAVCEPSTSSYGSGEWDEPCAATRRATTVQVTAWLDAAGHPNIDFEPNVRFVPSALPSGWVTLTLADHRAAFDPGFDILSCEPSHGRCHGESDDTTLETRRDATAGTVERRIKHFSGYRVATATGARLSAGAAPSIGNRY